MVGLKTAEKRLDKTIGILGWTEYNRELKHTDPFDQWVITSTAYTETGEGVLLKVSSESDELNCYGIRLGSDTEFSIPLE